MGLSEQQNRGMNMHPIFKQALAGVIPLRLLSIDELSSASKEKVIKEFGSHPNRDGSLNSREDIIEGLRQGGVLFDTYGNIKQG